MCSKLELIIGPMFSGKSTELIRRIRLYQKINKKILVLKPIIDIRYKTNMITSHNYDSVECKTINKLNDISEEEIIKFDTVIIDEGQFFPDLVNTIVKWIDFYNLNIIVGGLDGDFERKPIGQILELIPYADKCKKITSLCNKCNDGTKAIYTYRLVESGDKILIGGAESYIPLCRKHYNELKNK